jgi:hypothetical protein
MFGTLMLPVGGVLLWRWAVSKRLASPWPGLACLAFFTLTQYIASTRFGFVPIDWMLPIGAEKATAEIPGYRVTMIQAPGNDFYRDTLRLTRPDGKSVEVVTEVDALKCWQVTAEQTETRLQFRCDGRLYHTSVDLEQLVVQGGSQCYEGCRIETLHFR